MSLNDRRGRPPVPRPIGALLAPLYGMEIARRNRRFDAGVGVERGPIPVISVGNLSVGGTGKTPMVRWVVRTLAAAGRSPGVALRGYRAADGEASDEHREHEAALGVPVASAARRIDAVRELAHAGCDVAVLDDGFQHRWLARDFDLVLIDATRDAFSDRLLPAGWLREPTASLRRADAAVLTRADMVDDSSERAMLDLAARAMSGKGDGIVASCAHAWTGVRRGVGERERVEPVGSIDGASAVVVCGIGHPAAFVASATRAGVRVHSVEQRRDHHHYTADEVRALLASLPEGAVLLTTEKDWMKLSRLMDAEEAELVVRPALGVSFRSGEQALRQAVRRAVEDAGRGAGRELVDAPRGAAR